MNRATSNNSSSSDARFRVAVIGGGLSGLAAAHRLEELSRETELPLDVTLFEAGERLGGVIGTQKMDGYLVERGSDSFITNKPWAVDLCQRLGLQERLIPTDDRYRRSLVLRRGKPVAVPEGFMLLAPARILPVLKSPIFSPWGKLRMGLEYMVPRRLNTEEDESLAHFVCRRFGKEALERLVQPLVGGIYTSDPEKLSLKATMPRFLEMERQYRSLIRASRKQNSRYSEAEKKSSGARYGLFTTLEGGLSELLEELESRIAKFATIRLRTPIVAVSGSEGDRAGLADSRWTVSLEAGNQEGFDAIVLAVPTYRAAGLLAEFDSELADTLREIEYASTAIVVTGHRLADIRHRMDAFGLVVPAIEQRKILAVSLSSRKFPGRAPEGHILLRTFVGGAMQPELLEASDEKLVKLVRGELAEIFGVSGREDFSLVSRYERAMPQYHVGHLQRVERIERRTAQHVGLKLAGNAYHGVGIPDCIHSGERAAEGLFQKLCRNEPTTSGKG